MRFVLGSLVVVLVAACDAVDERSGCATSSDCPAGQYCAVTADGNVCWADASPPVVSGVTLACDTTPCLRDGTLRIEATVEDDREVAGAEARLDLDPGKPIALSRSGTRWGADVPLRGYAFEAFERPVVATVTASDGARTTSAAVASGAVQVTRLRWIYTATNALTSPAVMDDGTVVVGVANTSDQLLAVRPDGTKAWSLTVGTGQITAAPAVGHRAIWVGGADGVLHALLPDGSAALTISSPAFEGPVRGSVALSTEPTRELAFAASEGGRVAGTSTQGGPYPALRTDAYGVGPVLRIDGKLCAATSAAVATVRCYTFDNAVGEDWATNVGVSVSAPVAVDGRDNVWTGTQDARLNRTTPAGETATVAVVSGAISDSPVFLAGGDVIVPDQSRRLSRFSSAGTSMWSPAVDLPGVPNAPLVLAGTEAALIVTTRNGDVLALDETGTIVWQESVSSTELRAPNLFTPSGQTSQVLSTAYISSANGKLYAVIVDGQLDTASPWPKAFHDARNTNNAGTQP